MSTPNNWVVGNSQPVAHSNAAPTDTVLIFYGVSGYILHSAQDPDRPIERVKVITASYEREEMWRCRTPGCAICASVAAMIVPEIGSEAATVGDNGGNWARAYADHQREVIESTMKSVEEASSQPSYCYPGAYRVGELG